MMCDIMSTNSESLGLQHKDAAYVHTKEGIVLPYLTKQNWHNTADNKNVG